ncbi:NAD-dependent deacylase [Halapricum hydrolyticum]|uniref:NAD-dependent deacylase n=1 Tax=Halapricum hydrolyticum TaxID=2979991 RepID=A0AAE3IDF3_9EURY|nr:NAD-dependent deacylase [Halapricum hydrolyticum]MCU4717380.1 NAD-dependent deacylase [Halapricum hydrolyticum]MCU4726544.1 NAD-dependent deacylase [Halapricum hydrolyticum]
MNDRIESLAAEVADAERVVALTGAGVSTASGIPSFRGEGGIWEQFDQRDFHYRRFDADPAGFWRDRIDLRETFYGDGEIEPNAAHEALADLEGMGYLDAAVTQNVDGLHGVAGSETVIELHGTNREAECVECGRRIPAETAFERAEDGELPPRCEACGGVLKPAVVLFGESMPDEPTIRAHELAGQSDLFLAIGSSLQVQPAAGLPARAQRSGATLAIVNLEETPVSDRAEYDLREDVTAALPALVEAVE